jgi:hypothetical protein
MSKKIGTLGVIKVTELLKPDDYIRKLFLECNTIDTAQTDIYLEYSQLVSQTDTSNINKKLKILILNRFIFTTIL